MVDEWTDPEFVRGRMRRKTIWLVGIVLHVLLFAGLGVWPYFRGDLRGREARRNYGHFAACFYGGEVTGEAGLSLPRGDRIAYASQFLYGPPDWPERCRPLLHELFDGEPLLLYPGVKTSEARVREAAALADAELLSLAEERRRMPLTQTGRVPVRVLEGILGVSRQLSEAAHEMDSYLRVDAEVISLRPPRLAEAARVPLTTAADAIIRVRAIADGLSVDAVDARGLSRTIVGGGRTQAGRIRRPGVARAFLGADRDPWIVFATNPDRCADDEHRCARRSTGLARWVLGEGAAEPVWFSGHPRERPDRSISVTERFVFMLVLAADAEGAELRRSLRPDHHAPPPPPDETGERERVLIAPTHALPLEGVTAADASLLIGERAFASVTDEAGVEFRSFVEGAASTHLATLTGASPFLVTCGEGAFLAVGTDQSVVIFERQGEGGQRDDGVLVERYRGPALGTAEAVDPRYPERDRIRGRCDHTGASFAFHGSDDMVRVISCPAGDACVAPAEVATAAAFDLARVDGATVVAWIVSEEDGAVRAQTLPTMHTSAAEARSEESDDDGADAAVPARIIAACFADGDGFCGPPRLAAAAGRVLVITQERADLRVLESSDRGATFGPLRGIR